MILVPVLVAAGMILLITGVDLPKTLYGLDQAIREFLTAAIEAVNGMF